MKVAELIAFLQTLPPDMPVMRRHGETEIRPLTSLGERIHMQRGHYTPSEFAKPFVGEWRPAGRVVKGAMNLGRIENAIGFLVKV